MISNAIATAIVVALLIIVVENTATDAFVPCDNIKTANKRPAFIASSSTELQFGFLKQLGLEKPS